MSRCLLIRILAACAMLFACAGIALAQSGSTVTDLPAVAETPDILNSAPDIPGAAETRDLLQKILAGEKYVAGEYTEVAQESWLEKAVNWFKDLLQGFGIPVNSDLSIFMAAALAILLIAIIVRIVWDLVSRRSVAAEQNEDSDDETSLTAGGLRSAASKAADAGDLRRAMRLRFLAVLAEARVPFSTVMTNTQIRRLIRREHPGISDKFGGLVIAFENVWYGGMQLSTGDYSAADELAQSLEQELGGAD